MSEYANWFQQITGFPPHPWQERLAAEADPSSRIIRIPTGMGKSAGTLLAWLYHRVVRDDARWPRRLAFVLPMRTLADQVARDARHWVEAARANLRVHLLMGGVEAERWVGEIERPAILIGTQDMLLSRALNRGYGSARGLWPMEFGALHHDTLWIFDEIQLMGVGLATSTQLQAFRDALVGRSLRGTWSWWMSATLQPSWLDSIDFRAMRREHLAQPLHVPEEERKGGIWESQKGLDWRREALDARSLAKLVLEEHQAGSQSLVVVNTVKAAVDLYVQLHKETKQTKGDAPPELRLAHSRFRPHERKQWNFLGREAEENLPQGGRILIATQIVEAGVDISASLLITELAPYPSLVQRFGRAGRRPGQAARVLVIGEVAEERRKALPYTPEELHSAGAALERLLEEGRGVSIRALEESEAGWGEAFLREVYPYKPDQLLRRQEFEDLFDTTPDISGADLDVGRYIRVGDERDVRVFFREIDEKKRILEGMHPTKRDELCPAPAHEVEDFCRKADVGAYLLDFETGHWVRAKRFVPGMTLLLPASGGGYDPELGWAPSSKKAVTVVGDLSQEASAHERVFDEAALVTASQSLEDDSLSQAEWKTIAFHGRETAEEAADLARHLHLPNLLARLLLLTARWHDLGKAHPAFSGAIRSAARETGPPLAMRNDLAKAPAHAWRKPAYPKHPGFRHELASTLALFEFLKRSEPDHPAVKGFTWPDESPGKEREEPIDSHSLAHELRALSVEEFDLLAYLVCSHHGKVRCNLANSPLDQKRNVSATFGIAEGEELPATELADEDGGYETLPVLELSLELASVGLGERFGRSWGERVAGLLERYGPFTLAFLEALFRVADWRASRRNSSEER